jgi:hypothetical protein
MFISSSTLLYNECFGKNFCEKTLQIEKGDGRSSKDLRKENNMDLQIAKAR